MGNMTRSDSPVSRRIVLSFVDFLNSVELAPGANHEALEVAKDCLESLFCINSSSTSEMIQPGLLLELFTCLQANEQDRARPDPVSRSVLDKPTCSASTSNIQEESNKCTTSNSEGQVEETFDLDHAGDELFAKFYAALDEINFFKISPAGDEDPDQLSKTSQFFGDALLEVRKSGRQVASLVDLAEFFKSKGNDFMRSKQHLKAVELYTGAIALSRKNAIYYCNRAAAYTLLNMCNEAVEDCLKSIEIDPNYSKAYSRLGSAYFSMGNFHDALHKGYLKASELEPGNENVRLNIEVTKRKLAEQRAAPGQNTHARQGQESHSWFGGQASSGVPFTVFPPGSAPPPPEFFNMMNLGPGYGQQPPQHSVNINLNDIFGHANVNGNAQGHPSWNPGTQTPPAPFPANTAVPPAFSFMGSGNEENHAQQASGGHGGGQGEPTGAQTDAGIHINIGENMVSPEQAAEALRAVMQMFGPQMGPNEGGGAPRGAPPPPPLGSI
ncbi:small glutamine-rich tetratricopeptide repeat-containing protein-like [Hordeum vulgare subsp. vulgare]|uniref:small glutamine-rich tetratricopeptide repeat-containing protein-like n=1 Tax=Hordeum vulgare subsp. vulgare TaxID=112509 RepID=UPI001D1A45F1|nr:small glutamine-rich tetratricopeptide repeat-containing protein-like [Hordeum vulgare subsp. vulgare]